MNINRKVAAITAFLILVTGIFIGSAVYFMTRPTGLENEMRPVRMDTAVEYSLNDKLGQMEEAIRKKMETGVSGEVRLSLTEEELSILLVKMMQEAMTESTDTFSNGMVIDCTVNINRDDIKAIVDIEMYGISVQAGASLQASVDDKGISLMMYDLEIGQLPFAGSIEEQIASRFNQTHTHMKLEDLHIDIDMDLPVELKNLVLGDREMILIGEVT